MWPIILLGMIATATCLPLEDKEELTPPPTTETIEQLQKTVNIVAYIQNFKHVMAEYVNNHYHNLTLQDMEKIRETIEEFLFNLANDLRQTVEDQQNIDNVTFEKERENIQDGVPDETFVQIKEKIKMEFPDIKDETADVIVFKLRRNLHVTRQKIDTIIKSSEREFEYAVA